MSSYLVNEFENRKEPEKIVVPEEWLTPEKLKERAGEYEIKEVSEISPPTNLRMVDRTHSTVTLKWNAGIYIRHQDKKSTDVFILIT